MNERFVLERPTELRDLLSGVAGARQLASNVTVGAIARFGHAKDGDVCFCDRDPSGKGFSAEKGAIVLTTEELAGPLAARMPDAHWVALSDPRSAFIEMTTRLLAESAVEVTDLVPRPFGVHPTATVGDHCSIHPESRVDERAAIGHGCVIHRGVWIQAGAVVRDRTVIGCEGIDAHSGKDGVVRRFAHLAGVVVGKNAIIGACVVIPRGILTSTRIGQNSVVGNLSNVGHGVVLEEDVWMSAGCFIGGHSRIGSKASIGIGATVKDNVVIGAGAQVGMGSVVIRPVNPGASVIGNPARSMLGEAKAGPER
jgi:UDP-3-O-[3-hydroxymyristoyl] glucosamine N-acyltransferase